MKEISKAVLRRLPSYLSYLRNLPDGSSPYISATTIANALGRGEVQVRKDLASVSDGGRPKIGYLREDLIDDIEQFLGYDNTTDAVLIGAGKLGQALMGYKGFEEYGLNILAAFDVQPAADKAGEGKPIYPMEQMQSFCKSNKDLMGIITVPAAYAQAVAAQCKAPVICTVPRGEESKSMERLGELLRESRRFRHRSWQVRGCGCRASSAGAGCPLSGLPWGCAAS